MKMNERMKVLEMLKNGTITVEEAEKLLRAVDENHSEVEVLKKSTSKTFNIDINSADGDNVHINLPLNLLKLFKGKAIKFGGSDKVNEVIDQLDFDQLLDMAENGAIGEIVNIKSADGDTVVINVK
jgi:hypothetical protein